MKGVATMADRARKTYFIQDAETLRIKIGVSDDPQARLKSLQCGSSTRLRLLGSIDGDLEAELHRRLSNSRLHGEWFEPSSDVLDAVPSVSKCRLLSPPQIARRLGIKASKVIAWINRGELVASNVAASSAGRPRWRISLESLNAFLQARASKPPAAQRRARRKPKMGGVTEYF